MWPIGHRHADQFRASSSPTVRALAPLFDDAGGSADKVATNEDTSFAIAAATLTANDSDPNNDPISLTAVSNAINGTVALDNNNNVVFTPAANFSGIGGFDYTITDGKNAFGTGHVTVDIAPKADPAKLHLAAPAAGDDFDASVPKSGHFYFAFWSLPLRAVILPWVR